MTRPRQVSTSTVIDRPIFPHFSAVVMRSSWPATSRSRWSRPPLPRLYLSHFRRRSTTSKSIGPSLGVSLANAPCVCALRSLATAAPHPNPIVIWVMSLLAAAAVANDGIAQTQGASARNLPRFGPIHLEVVLRGRKCDKQSRSSLGLCPVVDRLRSHRAEPSPPQ